MSLSCTGCWYSNGQLRGICSKGVVGPLKYCSSNNVVPLFSTRIKANASAGLMLVTFAATGYCSAFPQPRSLMSCTTLAAASSLTSRAPSTGMCFGSASGQSSFSKPARACLHLLIDEVNTHVVTLVYRLHMHA